MLLKRLLAVTLLLGACQMMMAGQFIMTILSMNIGIALRRNVLW